MPGRATAGTRSRVEIDDAIRTGPRSPMSAACCATRGIRPDIIVGHNGWGETLFVKDVFPDVPLLAYFEFFYHPYGVDVDFDPEFASIFVDNPSRLRAQNAVNLLGLRRGGLGPYADALAAQPLSRRRCAGASPRSTKASIPIVLQPDP